MPSPEEMAGALLGQRAAVAPLDRAYGLALLRQRMTAPPPAHPYSMAMGPAQPLPNAPLTGPPTAQPIPNVLRGKLPTTTPPPAAATPLDQAYGLALLRQKMTG